MTTSISGGALWNFKKERDENDSWINEKEKEKRKKNINQQKITQYLL